MAIHGEFRDLVVDQPRGRLYASDAGAFTTHGVVVFDLASHALLARIPLGEPSGLDLSPDGRRLVVASMDGSVHLLDLTSLTWQASVYFTEGWAIAMAWDIAFIDPARVIVTLAQSYNQAGGYHQAAVINLTSASVEGWFTPNVWGFSAFAEVHADVLRHRAYLIDAGTSSPAAYVYLLGPGMPSMGLGRSDANFTRHSVLSPDGLSLYFTTGKMYDAATLAFQRDLRDAGEVDPGASGSSLYFAYGPHLDKVRSNDLARLAQFSFRGEVPSEPDLYGHIHGLAVDESRGTAFVVSGRYTNARTLRAVPLANALLDPAPPDGTLLRDKPASVSVVVSGNISPSALQMAIDGNVVTSVFSQESSTLGYFPTAPQSEGRHHVVVSGLDESGAVIQLEWNYSVDSLPPEILLDPVANMTREPHIEVTGHVLDANLRGAWMGAENLSIDPVDGSFRADVSLSEGGNVLGVSAEDVLQHGNATLFNVLYVPPTARFVHERSGFSLEFPATWTVTPDARVGGLPVDLLVHATPTASTSASVVVVSGGPLPDASVSSLLSAGDQVLANLSSLPGFLALDGPVSAAIPGLRAVTYALTYNVGSTLVFQRQYLVASPDGARSWALTFTATMDTRYKYDPLFEWIAGTMRQESSFLGLPLFLWVVIGSSAAGAAVAVGLFLFLRRRRLQATKPLGPSVLAPRPDSMAEPPKPMEEIPPPKQPLGPPH